MVAAIIIVVTALPTALLGWFFLRGRGAFLLAGYNTMSPEEQAKWDAPALLHCAGKAILGMVGCMLLWAVALWMDQMWLFWVSFAAFVLICIGLIAYVNTDERFRR